MAGRTCALVGCRKACGARGQLACGELHHLLLMAGRYNSAPQHPFQRIQDRNSVLICALESCSRAPLPGHPWCSRTHFLDWLSRFYAALSPLQICRLPGCNRHVYVSDSDQVPPSQFCGRRHCQQFAMLGGIEQQQQNEPQLMESEGDEVTPMKSFLHAFEDFVHKRIPPKNVKVDNEFFWKHPWEVLAEGHECYVIARCKFASTRKKNKQRDLVTKDLYHWKQQGPPKEKGGFCRKYFSYKKLNGTKESAVQHDDSVYTMKEYVMDGVDSHSFVKLRKGAKKVRKGGKRRRVDDDTKACLQTRLPLCEALPRAPTPDSSAEDLLAWDWDTIMACCLQTSHPQSEAHPRALIPDRSQDLPSDMDSLGSAGPRLDSVNDQVMEELFCLDDFFDEMPSPTSNVSDSSVKVRLNNLPYFCEA